MLTTLLKDFSLDDLIRELINREKQLELSKMNKADNHLVEFNKNQLQKVQNAIIDKTQCGVHFVLKLPSLPPSRPLTR